MKIVYSEVSWQPADIMEAACTKGIEMSYLEAEQWLIENGDAIKDRLIEIGWDIIDDMLEGDKR